MVSKILNRPLAFLVFLDGFGVKNTELFEPTLGGEFSVFSQIHLEMRKENGTALNSLNTFCFKTESIARAASGREQMSKYLHIDL